METRTAKEAAEELGVPYRTLMNWVGWQLINPACSVSTRRKSQVRFSKKDLREAAILRALRNESLSLQQLRESMRYLRTIGHNPFSTGAFLVVKGRGSRALKLLKFCTDGTVIDLAKHHEGQLVMPMISAPSGEVSVTD